MLPKGTPGWVYEAHRNRLLLEEILHQQSTKKGWWGTTGAHITHRRAGHRKNSGWRQPEMTPYVPR